MGDTTVQKAGQPWQANRQAGHQREVLSVLNSLPPPPPLSLSPPLPVCLCCGKDTYVAPPEALARNPRKWPGQRENSSSRSRGDLRPAGIQDVALWLRCIFQWPKHVPRARVEKKSAANHMRSKAWGGGGVGYVVSRSHGLFSISCRELFFVLSRSPPVSSRKPPRLPFSLCSAFALSASSKTTAELSTKIGKLLPKVGNIVADDVPVSDDEDKDNKVVSTFGPNPTGDQYMHHHEVGGGWKWGRSMGASADAARGDRSLSCRIIQDRTRHDMTTAEYHQVYGSICSFMDVFLCFSGTMHS